MRHWLIATLLVTWTLLAGACGEAEDPNEGGFAAGYELVRDAAGVAVHSLSLNQGVEVTLIRGGYYLEPEQRNAPLVAGRPGRARLELDPAAGLDRTRPVLARIRLIGQGRPEFLYEQLIEPGPEGPLEAEVWIEGEALVPGVELGVELWEVRPSPSERDPAGTPPTIREPRQTVAGPEVSIAGADSLDVDVVARWRNDSREPLFVGSEDLRLRVVLVPLVAAWSGCERVAPVEALRLDARDALLAFNPVADVEVEVREHPLVVEAKPEHLADLFPALQAARDADSAAPNTYYYGLLDACTGNIGGYGGLAFRAAVGPEPEDAWQRVAVGLHWPESPSYTFQTLVHELGHLQGLHHVTCPTRDGARAPLPDLRYPHAEGTIGVAGLNIVTGTDHAPDSSHDYMSYCYASHWVSDWTWARSSERIEILSAWDHAEPLPDSSTLPTTLLVGMIDQQGGQRWWTRVGRPRDAEHLAQPARLSQGATTLVGGRERLAEGEGELLIFALPPELALEPKLLEGALLELDPDYSIGGAGGGGSPKHTPISRIM